MHLLRIGGVALAALLGAAGALTSVLLAHGAGVPVDELVILLVVVAYALVAVLVSLVRPGQLVGRLLLAGSCAWGSERGCWRWLSGPPSRATVRSPAGSPSSAICGGSAGWCWCSVFRLCSPTGAPRGVVADPSSSPAQRSPCSSPALSWPHAAGLPADRPRQPDRAAAEPPDSRRLGRPARGGAHRGEPGRRDRWPRAPLANR